MTDKREPIPDAERQVQAIALQALGKQFEQTADALAEDLVAIVQWLRGSTERPEYAFEDCPARLDRVYFLLHEIGRITGRASRT